MKNRLQHFDVIKLAAIMWIFGVHFIAAFRPSLFRFWSEFPTSLFLRGVSGKFATTVLSVILGHLAYQKGTQQKNLLSLVLKRYLSFFVMGLFANVIYALQKQYSFYEISTLKEILITSLKIGSEIFSTFWCMESFFWGSVISYINGKYAVPSFPVLMQILMLMCTQNTWIAICLLGNVLYRITETNSANPSFQRIISKPIIQLFVLLFVFFAIKRSESQLTYLIDGICSVLILTVISYNVSLRKAFSNRFLSYLGKYSMGIFILHPAVYKIVGNLIYSFGSDSIFTFFAAFIASVLAVIPLSIVLVRIISLTSKLLMQAFVFIDKKLCGIFYGLINRSHTL